MFIKIAPYVQKFKPNIWDKISKHATEFIKKTRPRVEKRLGTLAIQDVPLVASVDHIFPV